ncbi:MAG: hypothetical protein ACOY4K_00530 [Pseudomonadota bacterium]
MTAETLTATRAASTFPVPGPAGFAGLVRCAYGTYTIAANVEDGDIFEMCRLPAGATIVGGWFYGADLDTGTETLDMDIGWAANGGSGTYDAADPDGLGNLGVLTGDAFAAGNVSPVTGLQYPLSGVLAAGTLPSFTAETVIQIEANAAAATGGTGAIALCVFYVLD